MISPFGLPLTNVAAAFDIFCFFDGAKAGEDCFGYSLKAGVAPSRKRSNEGGAGLRSDATETMIACRRRLDDERWWMSVGCLGHYWDRIR